MSYIVYLKSVKQIRIPYQNPCWLNSMDSFDIIIFSVALWLLIVPCALKYVIKERWIINSSVHMQSISNWNSENRMLKFSIITTLQTLRTKPICTIIYVSFQAKNQIKQQQQHGTYISILTSTTKIQKMCQDIYRNRMKSIIYWTTLTEWAELDEKMKE